MSDGGDTRFVIAMSRLQDILTPPSSSHGSLGPDASRAGVNFLFKAASSLRESHTARNSRISQLPPATRTICCACHLLSNCIDFGPDASRAGVFSFGNHRQAAVRYAPSVELLRAVQMSWPLFDITDASIVLRVALIGLFVLVILLSLRGAA